MGDRSGGREVKGGSIKTSKKNPGGVNTRGKKLGTYIIYIDGYLWYILFKDLWDSFIVIILKQHQKSTNNISISNNIIDVTIDNNNINNDIDNNNDITNISTCSSIISLALF